MRRFLKAAAAMLIIATVAMSSLAASSKSSGGGGSSGGTTVSRGYYTAVTTIGPNMVALDGNQWTLHPNGTWTYGQLANTWAADITPTNADWYRFDSDGIMLTGWYLDTDGNRYYLNPVADGKQGRMVTGWQQIGGKWYFFKTVSDGTRGSLLVNTTTPDGYRVGADGARIN